jgi:hypothetical protein
MALDISQSAVRVYDPRGVVEAKKATIAPRVKTLAGLKLGILDNTKWNGNKLLRKVLARLEGEHNFAETNYYRKESFSKVAAPELITKIVAENDVVVTAIGD